MLLVTAILRHVHEKYVGSLFACNNAISPGETQIPVLSIIGFGELGEIGQHITSCNFMLYFVTVCTIRYLLLSCDHRSLL